MHSEPDARPSASIGNEEALLQLIRQFMDELHLDMRLSGPLSLDSSLDRDLGLDSLARVELLTRLEQKFDISLSENVLATAETPRDLLLHFGTGRQAAPAPPVTQAVPSGISDETDLAPHGADTLVAVLDSHVQAHPDRIHLIFEQHPKGAEQFSYADLKKGALRLAAGLQQHNLEPGDTVAIMLANIRAMGQATAVTAADVFVSWLPLYHDMGLIGAWLGSLYFGCRLVIMQPLAFLARPERWLWAIHNHRGTLSASPNFGYEFCSKRLDDNKLKGLDLSSWRLAFNGAEPVSPETITNFADRFAPYGFRPQAAAPVYGLAESSVGLAFPLLGRKPVIDRVRRSVLLESGRAVPARMMIPHP